MARTWEDDSDLPVYSPGTSIGSSFQVRQFQPVSAENYLVMASHPDNNYYSWFKSLRYSYDASGWGWKLQIPIAWAAGSAPSDIGAPSLTPTSPYITIASGALGYWPGGGITKASHLVGTTLTDITLPKTFTFADFGQLPASTTTSSLTIVFNGAPNSGPWVNMIDINKAWTSISPVNYRYSVEGGSLEPYKLPETQSVLTAKLGSQRAFFAGF